MLPSMALSQVVVERSKEKVVISGVPYFIHQVKKGETPYSIARAYNITVPELTRENPPAVYGIKEGQTLRIPANSVTANIPVSPVVTMAARDESKYVYHRLQRGDTVYSLSRRYGVSENEILTSNPGIEISKLPTGAEIAIPRREFMSQKQVFSQEKSDFIFHKVTKGETLTSIAEKYGLTIKELRRENKNIRFPQVGEFIKIPGVRAVTTPDEMPVTEDTLMVAPADSVIIPERPEGYTPVSGLKGSMDVAVLLPFYLRENALRTEIDSSGSVKGKKTYKVINRHKDWIYPRSIGFVELYQGILFAADTLRSLGLDINMHVYDILSDTVGISRLINSGELNKMDLIIGPVHSGNLAKVASWAGDRGIPVVSPVQLINNSVLSGNPSLFVANSTLEVAQNRIASEMGKYPGHNFVFITDTLGAIDPGVKKFRSKILSEISSRIPYEEIRFKELVFYSRSVFGRDSINRLSHSLSDQVKNVIIIASEDAPVLTEAIQEIHSLSKKFDISVYGYPMLRDLENIDPKYLFELNLMVFSPYWIDISKDDVKQFNSDFRKKFFTEPPEMSFAWTGFDIAYYFLSGLAIHGKEFIEHPGIHKPDLLQTDYDFRRNSLTDGFENQKLFLIRYSDDYEINLVDEVEVMPGYQDQF